MSSNWYTWPFCNHGHQFQDLPSVISCDSEKCSWFRVWPGKLVHPRRRSSIPYTGNTLRVWPGTVGPHNQQPLCGCSKLQRRHGKRVIIILPTPSRSSQTMIQNETMSHSSFFSGSLSKCSINPGSYTSCSVVSTADEPGAMLGLTVSAGAPYKQKRDVS